MRLSILAWRGLAARPLRTGLTVAGVAIGVAAVTATLVAGRSAEGAVARAAAELLGAAELRVVAMGPDGLSARSLDALRALPGVWAAAPLAERRLTVTTAPGPGEQVFTLLVLGVEPEAEARVRPPSLSGGIPLRTASSTDALVDASWAAAHGLGLGDELRLTGRRPEAPPLRISGLLEDSGLGAVDGGEVVVVSRPVLDAAFGVPAPITTVDVDAAAGRLAEVERALAAAVREPFAVETAQDVAAALRHAQTDLAGLALVFALVSVLVGGFVAGGCLAINLGERTREVGLLRGVGATRRQVGAIFLVQSAVIGLAGSGIGAVLGCLLAPVLLGALRATRSLLVGDPIIPWAGVGLAIVLGVLAALAGGLLPARAASRLSPVESLRPSQPATRGIRAPLAWLIPMELVALVLAVVAYPLARGSLPPGVVAAALAVLVAGVVVVSAGVGPLARMLGTPLDRLLGPESMLGRANLARDRARTGLTAGALGMALAGVVALGALADGARTATAAWVSSILPGGAAIRLGLPLEADQVRPALEATIGVRAASPVVELPAALRARDSEEPVSVAGIDPSLFQDAGALILAEGRRTEAFSALRDGGGALLPAGLAARHGLGVGERVALSAGGRVAEFRVAGLVAYSLPGNTPDGAILVSLADAADRFGVTRAALWTLVPQSGVAPAAFAAAVSETAAGLAGEVVTPRDLASGLARSLDRLAAVFATLALLSVAVAALGTINTLAVSARERLPEIAVLRASGMTSGQVQAVVVAEAATLGLVGALAAVVLGVIVAGIVLGSGAVGPPQPGPVVPLPIVLAVLLSGPAVAALAALYPARLAGRAPIVEHLKRHE